MAKGGPTCTAWACSGPPRGGGRGGGGGGRRRPPILGEDAAPRDPSRGAPAGRRGRRRLRGVPVPWKRRPGPRLARLLRPRAGTIDRRRASDGGGPVSALRACAGRHAGKRAGGTFGPAPLDGRPAGRAFVADRGDVDLGTCTCVPGRGAAAGAEGPFLRRRGLRGGDPLPGDALGAVPRPGPRTGDGADVGPFRVYRLPVPVPGANRIYELKH